jgi:hypothetical protein
LYITDYTKRSDLATPPMALWSRGLEGRIVTLELQGQQSRMADKMETGSFFTVKHMRLIERVMGIRRVVGRIGGPDRLIHKLNVNNPNEELGRLLKCVGYYYLNRDAWLNLPCRIPDGEILSIGKERWERQNEKRASLQLLTF